MHIGKNIMDMRLNVFLISNTILHQFVCCVVNSFGISSKIYSLNFLCF